MGASKYVAPVTPVPSFTAGAAYTSTMPEDPRLTLQRYVETLRLLPRHGAGKTALQLKAELESRGYTVTKRTVLRSLQVLEDVFPLECNKKSEPYGWRWMPGAASDFQGLTLAEALSLTLVADDLQTLLPLVQYEILKPRLVQARKLIEQEGGPRGARRWSERIRSIPKNLELVAPRVDPQVMKGAQDALLHGEQLSFDYQSLKDKVPSIRIVDPHGILRRDGVTYLIAQEAVGDDTVKQYALHRMKSATRTGRRARSRGFDFEAYLAAQRHEIGSGKLVRLKARVSEILGNLLRQTPLTPQMSLVEEGDRYLIEAEVRENLALHRWILGHGRNIEVLAPSSLRRDIREHLLESWQAYGP